MIEARKTEILNALRFPTIGDREEGIDTAYSGTCSWIWGNQPTSDGLSEFIPWLQRSDRLLWISGKAGCGKSTLMKHIYRHPRTRAEIQRSGWAGGKNLILLGYFFHDRGSDDQKSREGMLRSMLVQILDERRDLIPNVFAKWGFFDSNHSGDLTGQLQIPTDFLTWQNLRQSFFKMIESLQDSSLCFFLDGLDEYRMAGREKEYTEEDLDLIYDGENEDEAWGRSQWITDGHKEVSRFIHGLGSFENVKTCISSREMFPFDHEFQALPRIRVHHNTTTAIDQYCINRLDKEVPSLEHASSFASEIVGRSSGVFLWVRLVVDMLIDGKANGNNTQELWNTLERLPSRLGGRGGLYMHMLRNIDRQYLPESKGLFQLVMRWDEIHRDGPRLDIITLFLAQEVHSRDLALSRQVIAKDGVDLKTWNEWQERWETLEKRLKSRCGGLLEGTKRVQFMHQTAKQFLSRRYIWQEAFGIDTSLNPEVFTSLALAGGWIRRLKCCAETNPRRPKKELGINTEPIQWQTGGVTVWREEILYAVALTIGGPMAKDWPYSFREHSRGLLHEISNHSRQIEPE
ncbi:hypothetical protein GGR51DRAFT_569650 [Nemania sp. FL0031]|nr:hypothetical protein GGR51DRAFT_569650 [Nemania sp. FL0031]